MKKSVVLVFVFFMLTLIGGVIASDFSISEVSIPSDVYQGDSPVLTAKVSASSGNICDIECTWEVSTGPDYFGFVSGTSLEPSTVLKKGENEVFPFRVNAEGNGKLSYSLTVTCSRVVNYINCWPGDIVHEVYRDFDFSVAGDGVCDSGYEMCADFENFIGTSDCSCDDVSKICNPPSSRGADIFGCASFCGNDLVESDFENCSNCPSDAGKCDGVSCFNDDECEGGFCVHEKCQRDLYVDGDGFCDINLGENCKNSISDCSCAIYQRCSSSGVCESYCGNGICELSEKGICIADCKWCGDGFCSENENCISCSDDCGVCKDDTETDDALQKIKKIQSDINKEVEKTGENIWQTNEDIAKAQEEILKTQKELNQTREEIANARKEIVDAQKRQEKILFYTILGIMVVLIVYVLFKFIEQIKERFS